MKLNRNTKKAQCIIKGFNNSEFFRLSDCYKSYSENKRQAYKRCVERFYKMGGYGFRIISFNSNIFTCGWLYEDKETGVVMLNVETPYNTYTIEYK